MKINYLYIFGLILLFSSCGISEDCFKGNGNKITQTFPLEGFTKVKVYDGIGLVIKEGPEYEVRIETSDNIIDNLEVKLEGDMLVVKDNSTCNIARDYGLTVVYLTAPNLTEIHSKTNQDIKSDGVLNYPELRLYAIDLTDGAGTGDFYLDVESLSLYVESNNVSNFYINGKTNFMTVFFSWGNGIFYSSNLSVKSIDIFHRGSNNMILNPIENLSGAIYANGNVILINNPRNINVDLFFTGRIFSN